MRAPWRTGARKWKGRWRRCHELQGAGLPAGGLSRRFHGGASPGGTGCPHRDVRILHTLPQHLRQDTDHLPAGTTERDPGGVPGTVEVVRNREGGGVQPGNREEEEDGRGGPEETRGAPPPGGRGTASL